MNGNQQSPGTVRAILRMGTPSLLQASLPVASFDTPELHTLIADLEATMIAASGAGIAAPQIGVNQQVVIFGERNTETAKINPRYPDASSIPFTVLINPVLTALGDTKEDGWEGCLSVPGMRGVVPRFTQLRYQGFDAHGTPIDREVAGFHARVVQHEVDHLLGILYPMRVADMRKFGFTDILFPGLGDGDD